MRNGTGTTTSISAPVFDIERYALEDGPGIRTVVFFKGCNLRCTWCQNPESHEAAPQVMYDRGRCTACGRCVSACPEAAIADTPPWGFLTDEARCAVCGTCIEVCFQAARRIAGKMMTSEEILAEIRRDRPFYESSGGGVTFSGGEPLLYPAAVVELARACRAEGIHTALETAGHVPWKRLEGVLPWIDLLYFDFKHIDPTVHRAVTGVSNELILANLRRAAESCANLVVRIPVIPGVNADAETQAAMLAYLAGETAVRNVELLPFHRLGGNKYEALGLEYAFATTPNMARESCEPFAREGRRLGLSVRVGATGT
jgi:pyruvate formate lyase activating enzyme